jgi:hypothetical protein
MAHSAVTLTHELNMGNKRAKLYKVTLTNGQTTTTAITPGVGFGSPVGAYDSYTNSSGAFTFTTQDPGTTSQYSWIMFFSPVNQSEA